MANEMIRVLIADDHPIVRKGLRALLVEFDDIEFGGEVGDGREAVSFFRQYQTRYHPDGPRDAEDGWD